MLALVSAFKWCGGAGHGEAMFKFEIMGSIGCRLLAQRPSPQKISSA
jgi:hypothetical protein